MATNSLKTRNRRTTFAAPLAASTTVVPAAQSPNIGYVRQEVTNMHHKWSTVADCLSGQERVKAMGTVYLPMPNADDKSAENVARWDAYLLRAVFYNVTRRTLEGLVGQVFSRDPINNIPDSMAAMIVDVDGTGVSLDQQAKKGLALNIAYGGFGLLVDYPITSAPTSLADQKAGFIHPTIHQYHRQSITNWRHEMRGAKQVYSLIVIKETATVADDGFEITSGERWRVLQLVDGKYTVTKWREGGEDEPNYVVTDGPRTPLDAAGQPFTEIPFHFCGVLNNDDKIDEPSLYDLAVLNIAHYRNSADYEDSCYMVGQPTPFFAGLTQQWVDKVFKNKIIQLGSRAAIPLPVGGTAGLLQVAPNSMPFEAMGHKEVQMMALGAKLIEPGGGQNTLGQAQLDESSESSMLSTAAKNVSMAYTMALNLAAKMAGVSDVISYSLNTDFPASRLTPNERTQLVMEWQSGAITETEMRAGLRKAGVATLDEAEYKAELKKNPPPEPKAATNNGGKGGEDNEEKKNKDEKNNGGNQNKV